MERDMLTCALLFDVYGDMLTRKQRLCCDLRYNQDLSLGEIGELEGISRQAVRDNLLRAEAQMQEMEEKLGVVRRERETETAAAELRLALEEAEAADDCGAVTEHIQRALHYMEEGTHGL